MQKIFFCTQYDFCLNECNISMNRFMINPSNSLLSISHCHYNFFQSFIEKSFSPVLTKYFLRSDFIEIFQLKSSFGMFGMFRMFSVWDIESHSALSPPCLPCCYSPTGLVWKGLGRNFSLLEKACSFWTPRVGDLPLRTTEFFWSSWLRPLGNCAARFLVSFQKLLGLLTQMASCSLPCPQQSCSPPQHSTVSSSRRLL